LNFATLGYALFLVVVVAVYWLLPRRVGRYWLILASLIFYGSWNVAYVPGFVALVVANWGLGILAVRYRRPAVLAAVALNLGLLAFFKYANWALGSASSVLGQLSGQGGGAPPVAIQLPLAISFVTFTMLAYVIDIGRGSRPERNLGRFALFVTFFPHLIAGPIMRGRELLPQVRHARPFRVRFLGRALPLLVSGLLKKTIGDNLAPAANAVFADPRAFATWSVWVGMLAFAFQIFFDFSGYTDLALGSAHLLGFQLPKNFNWPYRSGSIREFWRRWHMTLSRWLRDYLYIPLGGSRHGQARTYLALMVTMLLGGLWHGAGLTFIVWGAWHGIGLSVQRLVRDRTGRERLLPSGLGWAATFLFVLLGWVFFRAASLGSALLLFERAFTLHGGESASLLVTAMVAVFVIGQWSGWTRLYGTVAPAGSMRRYATYGVALLASVLLLPVATVQFIYFQF
jgi:alginate O-acetyltransferase complex protein AlgI